ncbi:MAG: DNA repair protein RadC [Maricaulaceae bacterium]|nr:DNA repair protein RadC [Maricaulaceae bacterium]
MAEGADRPHHAGHRDRLRARFRTAGGEALADYELLELYLFRAIPRRDVKPLAKAIIAAFGGLGGAAAAPVERLMEIKGVSERVAVDIKLLHALAERIAREQVSDRPVIASWSALLDYCRTALQHQKTEQFRVLYLDVKNRLIADEVLGRGTHNHAPVYPREVVKRALALDAAAMILVHNHPSGDPKPSAADVEMTKKIVEAARPFEILVHDHLVIGRDGAASLKTLGLM